MMIRTACPVSLAGYRAFSWTVPLLQESIPPWLNEKLRNEGYTHDEIKKSGGWSLLKQQHAINPNTVFKLHKNYDISWTGYKNYRQKEKIAELIKDQEYVYDRFMKLGGELSAAVFLVHRGAAVRFHGRDKWFAADPDSYTYDLPSTFVRDWNIEAIDMRDFHIIHKGFENLAHCEKLRSLALRNQPYVDDWCLDFISAVFHSTLEFLDVSGCPNVTEKGLSVLHRCRNLRGLYMRHMPRVKNAELLAIHLEDVLPNVIIEGVDYWNAASPEN